MKGGAGARVPVRVGTHRTAHGGGAPLAPRPDRTARARALPLAPPLYRL